jgi:hypothetical protein
MHWRWIHTSLALVTLASCSRPTAEVSTLSLETPLGACAAEYGAYGAMLARCWFYTPDLEGLAGGTCASIARGVEAGRIAFDRSSVGACIEAIRNLPCDEWGEWDEAPAACRAMFAGRVAADGACFFAADCSGEDALRCVFDDPCAGRCVPYPKVGESCSNASPCSPRDDCVDGECMAPGQLGDPCDRKVHRCEAGLLCDGSTCVPLRTEGQPCDGIGDCAPALTCVQVDREYQCQPRRVEGEGCYSDRCALGLECHSPDSNVVAHTCRRMKREGERCEFGIGECEYPNVCNPATGTCVGPGIVGDSCGWMRSNGRAEVRGCWISYCNRSTSRCTAYTAPGESCVIDDECWLGCGEDRRCYAALACE